MGKVNIRKPSKRAVRRFERLKKQIEERGEISYKNGWMIVRYPSGAVYAKHPKNSMMLKITPERIDEMLEVFNKYTKEKTSTPKSLVKKSDPS